MGLGADWPGLGGLGESGAGMTSSSPDVSDSLSDSEIGRSFVDAQFVLPSFAGNRVALNFNGKFQCIGGLCPRTGILWILARIQQRSFLGS